jgi:hypothetical protein
MLPRQKRLNRAIWSALGVTLISVITAYVVRRYAITTDLTFPADGQFWIQYWETARNAYLRGDGFPLWDRAVCAGRPFLGNPDAPLVSSFIVGVFRIHGDMMHRWYPTVFAGLGVAGTFLWARRALKVSWLPSVFAGILFSASGFVSLHGAVRMTFAPFMAIPWVLWLAYEGERDLRAAAGSGMVLGLMLLEGAIFPFCFALVALAIMTLPRFFARDTKALDIVRMLGIVLLMCVLFGALKMIPVMTELARAPRIIKDTDAGPWADIIPMLGDSDRAAMPGRHYHINEFRGYIGPFAFGMAIAGAGVCLILKPRRIGLAFLLLGAVTLTRGAFSPNAPWTLLTRLPAFDQLQVPSRFVVLVDLAAAVCAAIALDAAARAVKRPLLLVPLVLAGMLAVYDPVVAGQKALKANITDPWLPRPDPRAGKYHLVPGDDFARMATYPSRNVGSAACHKAWPYAEGNGYLIGDHPQASLDGGKVTLADVHQNFVSIDAIANAPAALHLNQTFDPDFVTNVGTIKKSPRGTLDVMIPGGQQHVEVRYRPRGIVTGIVMMTIGVLGFVWTFVLTSRLRRRSPGRA